METAREFKLTEPKRMLAVSLLALFFLASAALQYKIKFSDAGKTASRGLEEKTSAPAFSLPDLKGERVSLESFRGKIVVLDFWATWCSPCRAEFTELRAWWEKTQNRFTDVAIVAVNLLEVPSLVQSYVEEMKLPFLVLLDADGKVAEQYRVEALPTLYVINQDGVITKTNVGYTGNIGVQLEYLIQSLHGGAKQ
jgi:peroxiredoxin